MGRELAPDSAVKEANRRANEELSALCLRGASNSTRSAEQSRRYARGEGMKAWQAIKDLINWDYAPPIPNYSHVMFPLGTIKERIFIRLDPRHYGDEGTPMYRCELGHVYRQIGIRVETDSLGGTVDYCLTCILVSLSRLPRTFKVEPT